MTIDKLELKTSIWSYVGERGRASANELVDNFASRDLNECGILDLLIEMKREGALLSYYEKDGKYSVAYYAAVPGWRPSLL